MSVSVSVHTLSGVFLVFLLVVAAMSRSSRQLGMKRLARTRSQAVAVVVALGVLWWWFGHVFPYFTSSSTPAPRPPYRYVPLVLKDTRPLTDRTPLSRNSLLWPFGRPPPRLLTMPDDRIWYSQSGQDRILYHGFFKHTYRGTFVELGAVDGISFSNTKFLQDEMGWSGVLIEPSPDFEFLVKGVAKYSTNVPDGTRIRKGSFHGKRCASVQCLNVAICPYPGGFLDMLASNHPIDGNMVSGAADLITKGHQEQFKLKGKANKYRVSCMPMGQVLHQAGITRVDLLSLDVEGAEEIVLETMDWDNIPVYLLVIESHEKNSPTGPEGHERKHRILLQAGFQFLDKIEMDEWWINPNNAPVTMFQYLFGV